MSLFEYNPPLNNSQMPVFPEGILARNQHVLHLKGFFPYYIGCFSALAMAEVVHGDAHVPSIQGWSCDISTDWEYFWKGSKRLILTEILFVLNRCFSDHLCARVTWIHCCFPTLHLTFLWMCYFPCLLAYKVITQVSYPLSKHVTKTLHASYASRTP